MHLLILLAALFVGYANGSNDNFKGVATLYGSRVLSYRSALAVATLATFAGAMASYFAGGALMRIFSGKGIVAAAATTNPEFIFCVAAGAALTVLMATIFGWPVSTTHALIGSLAGAGIAGGSLLGFTPLGKAFVFPLLAGPLVAVVFTAALYGVFHVLRLRTGIEKSTCLCVGEQQLVVIGAPGAYMVQSTGLNVTVDQEDHCRSVYAGSFLNLNAQKVVDSFHILSAVAVSFARGLNDAPKIAALMLLIPWIAPHWSLVSIALVMAIGGLIHSRKIANRLSFEITGMNPGQAFTGNMVTSLLVTAGSLWGMPLSTTHVSCGSLFGIGLVNDDAKKSTILKIVSAWIITLPLSMLISAILWFAIRQVQ